MPVPPGRSVSFSFSPVKEGTGIILGAVALLAIVLGEQLVAAIGWIGLYIGLFTLSLCLQIEGMAWPRYIWRKGPGFLVAFVAFLVAPPAFAAWWFWPRPPLVAYQICYNHIATRLPDGSPALARYQFAVRFLNGRDNDPIYFKVIEHGFALGGLSDDHPVSDLPLRVTSNTRNAYDVMAIDFIPPRPTPQELDGRFEFQVRYGRSEEGPFPGKMNMSGPISVAISTDATGAVPAFALYPGSDTRRVERPCAIGAKTAKLLSTGA